MADKVGGSGEGSSRGSRMLDRKIAPLKQSRRQAVKIKSEMADTDTVGAMADVAIEKDHKGQPLIAESLVPLLLRLATAQATDDEDEKMQIGQAIRMSSHFRSDIADSVTRLIRVIKSNFEANVGTNEARQVIDDLADVNFLSTLSNIAQGQPFSRLPREIRDIICRESVGGGQNLRLVLGCTLQTESENDNSKISPQGPMKPNHCDSQDGKLAIYITTSGQGVEVPLFLVSKQVSAEAMRVFYRYNAFNVNCTCQLYRILQAHPGLRNISFALIGSQRLEAIALLRRCRLEHLTISVGKKTTYLLDRTERALMATGLHMSNRRHVRVANGLGVKELRGIGYDMDIDVEVVKLNGERSVKDVAPLSRWFNQDPNQDLVIPMDDPNKAAVHNGFWFAKNEVTG